MKIEEKVPPLAFQATNNVQATLSDYLGKWLILYFYPKDATPGCTLESQEFRNAYPQIQTLNADVLGVSRDTITSHEKFKCKQELPFELISDADESLCKQFDVIKTKSLYGKPVRGIERSTFLIDPSGILKYEWRKLSVSGHVSEVLATLKNLIN